MASKKSELLVFVLEHNKAAITEPVCNLGGVTLLLSTRSNFCNIFGHKFYGTQFSFELHNKSSTFLIELEKVTFDVYKLRNFPSFVH